MILTIHILLIMFTMYVFLFLSEKKVNVLNIYLFGVIGVAITWYSEGCDIVLCVLASMFVGFQLLIVSAIVILQSINLKQNDKSKRKTTRVH